MSIISDLQAAAKVIKKAGNIELYEKLLAAQEKALEIMEENTELRQKIEKLEKKLKIKNSIVFEKEFYWLKDKEGKTQNGPFCPKCYDDEGLLIHLVGFEMDPDIKKCPKCKFVRQKL